MVRVFAWIQILIPTAVTVFTIPASLIIIVMGGIILVAPPIACGLVGLGIAKGLRHGHRERAAVALSVLQAFAYMFLALHSVSWDPTTQGEANFFLLARIVFWVAVAVNFSVPFILVAPTRAPVAEPGETPSTIPDLKPALWPWLVAAAIILALIVLGTPVAMEG